MRFIKNIVILVLIIGIMLIASCGKGPTVSEKPNAKTLVIVEGGLGGSQLNDVFTQVIEQCPEASVINANNWDGYKTDIVSLASGYTYEHLVIVSHSYGAYSAYNASFKFPKVDYIVFFDLVTQAQSSNIPAMSESILNYDWFIRSNLPGFLPVSAKIQGAFAQIVKGDHNSICHDQNTINIIVSKINNL